MNYSFNLITQPWIPCLQVNGQIKEFSLQEVLLNGNQLRSVQTNSPLETAAVYRLLLALLHSALRGPKRGSDWQKLWKSPTVAHDQIESYLDLWLHKFDLFDPRYPFYQAAHPRAKPKSVITLIFDMASGNNASLFDHHIEETGVSLTPAQAALGLVAAQTFGLAGTFLEGALFTDSPWSRGTIFFLEGDDLSQTLLLNLLPYPDDGVFPSIGVDRPAWEQDDPFASDRQIPNGYLDYLTWQSRRILLYPQITDEQLYVRNMTMGPGLKLVENIFDPMKAYRKNEKKEFWFSIRFSEERALWRDSETFLGVKTQFGQPPQPFKWFIERNAEESSHKFRFMALGMANDKAKVEFFAQQHLPVSKEYFVSPELVESLRNGLDLSEKIRNILMDSAKLMALLLISPKSDGKKWKDVDRVSKEQAAKLVLYWNIERYYWQQIERDFYRLLEDLPVKSEAIQQWQEALKWAAEKSLTQGSSMAGTDAIALKAGVRARARFSGSMKSLLKTQIEEVTA